MSAREFAINGRFLTQDVTGVQRYARNVVKAMDSLALSDGSALIVPANATDLSLRLIRTEKGGHLNGHAWEQIELPYLSGSRRLLNLCNTAPAAKTDQIVCIHDANIFAAPQSYSRAFRTLYHTLQPLLVRRSLRIACVSHAAARQLARHLPVRLSDIAVLPNGHEHALLWDPSAAELAPKMLGGMNAHRPFVLALGSRARHKNLSLLIDIAPELDEMNLDVVIAGGGDGIFTKEALQRRSNVHLLGRVSDNDLAYLLDRALCLAFPSFTEGFGLPIIEAMARSCPVVSSDCASMPEVCGSAALVASPFEPRQWIERIGMLQSSEQLRNDLAGRGQDHVRQFSWKKTAGGYTELLADPRAAIKSHKPADPVLPRVSVIFATRGRPHIVAASVRHFLSTQRLKPEAVLVSCVDISDAGDLRNHPDVTIVTGPPGLAAQRNTALNHVEPGTEIVAFFDDDFIADKNWLASALQAFRDENDVVSFTGHVLADGIKGPGISFQEAVDLVDAGQAEATWSEPFSPYGCNMAFRFSAIGDLRFDERLVLYGWLEDRDFAAALSRRGGRLVKSALAFGVHMGVKSGRVSGDRLGYSQVINPLYMLAKGTMSLPNVVGQIFRNIASNFSRAVWPEPFIDRRGRVRGNLLAAFDALRGRLEPERAAVIATPPSASKPRQR
ncbi:glycosyltransferase [Rhizobium mesoamericanum]|uniref:Glycosyltransferase protein n=1 Tax=Rhizobium mesoamericanum STM3625 TaxID=1211777 RepID=K0Q5A1_9HYPH|nr:glycosyltransferase [Rhizobium mesoamericanum]CCM78309.1 Glycosyltransferase protein [Rhizobium mesoamericanum STM3625]